MSRLHWVNDIVNFHVGCHIDGLTLPVGGIDHSFEPGLAFLRVADGLEFFSVAKANSTFEAHRTEFSAGPGDSEERSVEASAGHGLRSKSVSLT